MLSFVLSEEGLSVEVKLAGTHYIEPRLSEDRKLDESIGHQASQHEFDLQESHVDTEN